MEPQPHVDAWVASATQAMSNVTIATRNERATEKVLASAEAPARSVQAAQAQYRDSDDEDDEQTPQRKVRRVPSHRDSLRRREALLKGKEGSRRRQRWENDRLLHNPWAEPPLPSDWEVRPTYPRRTVPYFLAPLWEADMAARRAAEFRRQQERHRLRQAQLFPAVQTSARTVRRASDCKDIAECAKSTAQNGPAHQSSGKKANASGHTNPMPMTTAGQIPRELRATLKRAKAARALLQDLEIQVRDFAARWEAKRSQRHEVGLDDADSADEDADEVVFVGRSGQMHDLPPSPPRGSLKGVRRTRGTSAASTEWEYLETWSDRETGHQQTDEVEREKLVFGSLADDRSAAFGRWLVHSIASYYGLRTWSVTSGDPARREAYVGIPPPKGPAPLATGLPRPLWGLV